MHSLLPLLVILVAAPAGAARPRLLVRPLQPLSGAAGSALVRKVNARLWDKLRACEDVEAVSEAGAARRLAPEAWADARGCRQDRCHAALIGATGSDLAVWGWVQADTRGGWDVEVRLVSAEGEVLSRADLGCKACREADVLDGLAGWDPAALAVAREAPPDPAPQPPDAPKAPVAGSGRLTLTSSPVGAAVWTEGRLLGKTPLLGLEVPAGDLELLLRLPGHDEARLALRVLPGQEVRQTVALASRFGSLRVTSRPAGAGVLLDGEVLGYTPVKAGDLPVGEHVIDLWKGGREPVREAVRIEGSETVKLAVHLVVAKGTLVVESTPAGATVLVDGAEMGRTPLRGHKLPRGEHRVVVAKEGLAPQVEVVRVEGGATARVKAKLREGPPPDGRVEASSDPPGARVFLGTAELGRTPGTFSLAPGRYELRFELERHDPVTRRLVVRSARKAELHAELPRSPLPPGKAELTLIVEPEDADVFLNGRFLGRGAVRWELVDQGWHELAVRKPGFAERRFTVDADEGAFIELEKTLKELPPDGFLTVTSHPTGATVIVNDMAVGKTPLERYGLLPGYYTLALSLAAHERQQRTFEVASKREKTFRFRLRSPQATLSVVTSPPGATVFLDGEELGTAPGQWTGLSPGSHDLLVSRVGCEEHQEQLELRADELADLSVELVAEGATLDVRTAPPGATVVVDGVELGPSPVSRHEVRPGLHTVEARLDGYHAARGEVTLEPGDNRRLEIRLEKME